MRNIGYSSSSDLQSSSALIYNGPCALIGIDVLPPTTGTATATVYDGTSASGKILSQCIVDAGMPSLIHEYMIPVQANTGIYVSLSGSGSSFIVRFYPG